MSEDQEPQQPATISSEDMADEIIIAINLPALYNGARFVFTCDTMTDEENDLIEEKANYAQMSEHQQRAFRLSRVLLKKPSGWSDFPQIDAGDLKALRRAAFLFLRKPRMRQVVRLALFRYEQLTMPDDLFC